MSDAKKRLNIVLPADLVDKLRSQAEEDDRSMTKQAARYLAEKVEEREQEHSSNEKTPATEQESL